MEAGATKRRKERRVRQDWSPAQRLAMGSTDTPDPLVCWQLPKHYSTPSEPKTGQESGC